MKNISLFLHLSERMHMKLNIYFKYFIALVLMMAIFPVAKSQAQCTGISVVAVHYYKSTQSYVRKTNDIDSSGCPPYIATLKVLGAPANTIFKFYFGNQSPITTSNDSASTVITANGIYGYKVELSDNNGIFCTKSKDSAFFIGNLTPPQLSYNQVQFCNGPDSLIVTDNTPNIKGRIITIDGISFIDKQVMRLKLNSAGYKNMIYYALDNDSCTIYKKIDSIVVVYSPISIDFSANPTGGCIPFTTSFTPTIGSTNQTITGYEWTFTGGSPASSTSLNPGSVSYSNPGKYDVSLKVTTSQGCSYTKTKTQYINAGDTVNLKLSASTLTPCTKQQVTIYNSTVGKPSGGTTSWSVPSGYRSYTKSSNGDTIFLVYNNPGTHKIDAVFSFNGCDSRASISITVDGPIPIFTAKRRTDCQVPFSVQFSNISTNPPGSVSYKWRVSDSSGNLFGTLATTYNNQDSINHTFTKFGSYAVRLIATHSSGCIDSASITNYISIGKPQSKVDIKPRIACTCEKINFKNATSKFSDDTIRKEYCIFLQNKVDTLHCRKVLDVLTTDTAEYTFCDTGKYYLRFITWTDVGCRDTLWDSVIVTKPKVSLVSDTNQVCVNGYVNLTATSDPAVSNLTYTIGIWHKDSSINTAAVYFGSSVSPSFFSPGCYNAYVVTKVSGANNYTYCSDSTVVNNIVCVDDIYTDLKAASTTGCKNTAIAFDTTGFINKKYSSVAGTASFNWTTQPSTGVSIASPNSAKTNITFTENGIYDVALTVVGSSGCSYTVTKYSYVSIGVKADFDIPQNTCYKNVVSATNNSSLNPISYKWTVAPSAGLKYVNGTADTSLNPSFVFPDSGWYKITLRADKGSCFDTITKWIYVERIFPDLQSSISSFECAPKIIWFYPKVKGTANTLIWDFGNGNTLSTGGSIDSISNLYLSNDTCFNIKLIAISNNGCADTIVKKCLITSSGPVPKFSMNNNIGCEPLTVTFTDQSYNTTTKTFNYGNGNVTAGTFPSQTYYVPGNQTFAYYFPTLTGENSSGGGCANTFPQVGVPFDTIIVFKKAQAGFYVDTTTNCEPWCVQFHDTSKYATDYIWYFGDGDTSTAQNPVHCYKPGVYSVSLLATNRANCRDSIRKTNLITVYDRAKPAFTQNDSLDCDQVTVTFTNASTFSTSYLWDFGDGNTSTQTNPTHTFVNSTNSTQFYSVKLYATNTNGCADSIVKDSAVVLFRKAIPKFYTDSLAGCEPFTVPFKSDSTEFSSGLTWDFGDGGTATGANPTYTYAKPGLYNVKLVSANADGCGDSLVKNSYIRVYNRAIPDFSVSDSLGCENLTVNFTNNSQYADVFVWSFGDGNVSSQTNPSYTYSIPAGMNNVSYTVSLFAINNNGCWDTIVKTGLIKLAKRAIPKIYQTTSLTGCEPHSIDFFGDSSEFTSSWSWDFGPNATPSTSTLRNPVVSFLPGIHTVKMVVTNPFGCADSLTLNNAVEVYVKPTADFVVDKYKTCFGDSYQFASISNSNVPITSYYWDFGDGTFDTNSLPAPKVYVNPGCKTVTLYITNANGCMDTLERVNVVCMEDSIPPTATKIKYVTVDNPESPTAIQIEWEQNLDPTFYRNHLDKDDGTGFTEIYVDNVVTNTTYNDANGGIFDQRIAYGMRTSDSCGWMSERSLMHKNIVLDVQPVAPMTNQIIWTAYQGWGSQLRQYDVYKASGTGSGLSYYRSVGPTDTSTIDSLLCDSDYYYYVVAVHNNGQYLSKSNMKSARPAFIRPDTAVSINRATVLFNKYAHITWQASSHPALKNYVIDRYDSLNGWQYRYFVSSPLARSFTDLAAEINKRTYTYSVSAEDYCGNTTPMSTDIGRTILFHAWVFNDMAHMEWTPYTNWPNGIREYRIELDYGNGDWRLVDKVKPDSLRYIDKNLYVDLTTNYCYRVVAIEEAEIPDTSISNVECAVIPSKMFVPNAFTPNGRGPTENEVFRPIAVSIFNPKPGAPIEDFRDYEFRVYNEWGQRIFESHHVLEGWDGTYKGKPCPPGMYIYTIRARGLDKKPYDLNGQVTLVR